jgi:hypothetical protein
MEYFDAGYDDVYDYGSVQPGQENSVKQQENSVKPIRHEFPETWLWLGKTVRFCIVSFLGNEVLLPSFSLLA